MLNLDPAVDRLLFLGEGRGQALWRSFFALPTGWARYAPECASAELPGVVVPRWRAGRA